MAGVGLIEILIAVVVLGFGLPIQTPAAGGYTFHDVPPAHPFFQDLPESPPCREE